MLSNKTIIRTEKNKNNPYVMIDQTIFTDTRLSWKSKGLMGYLLSRPDGWQLYVADLIKRSTDGRDAVYAGIKELRALGYIEQIEHRKSNGKIDFYEYVVHEQPISPPKQPLTENPEVAQKSLDQPLTENPDTEKPLTENPTLVINDLNQVLNLVNNQQQPESVVVSPIEQMKQAVTLLSISVSSAVIEKWLTKYSLSYLLEKIQIVRSQSSNNPYRSLNAAIKEDWQKPSTKDLSPEKDDEVRVGSTGRVVPAAQPGKYERFYQVYKNQTKSNGH